MAILWYDGAENYGEGNRALMTQGLWDEVAYDEPSGRFGCPEVVGASDPVTPNPPVATGQYSWRFRTGGASMRRSLGGDFTTVGLMTRWYMTTMAARQGAFCIQQFRNVENFAHISIQIGATGRIMIVGGGLDGELNGYGTQLASSTLELAAGTFNHIETKVVLGASGSVEVRVNGKSYVTYSGNTVRASSGSASIAQVAFGQWQTNFYDGLISFFGYWFLDDIAVWNSSTTDNMGGTAAAHDFIGQYGVYYLPPNADASPQQWTLTVGTSAYALVNEIAPDDNLNYLFTNSVGFETNLVPSPLPSNVTAILAIACLPRMRKTDTGDCSVRMGCNSGGTEQLEPSDTPLVTSWDYYMPFVQEIDPHTSAAWNALSLPNMVVKRTL